MKGLVDIVKERVLLLDGAMGTMLQRLNLSESDFRGERFADVAGIMKGNNDMLNLTQPAVVSAIHRKYLEAGADIITTNTFSSQRISMKDYHLEDCCYAMAYEGARLARAIADEFSSANPEKPRFVAGSVGPTNQTCSMSPDVSNPAFRALSFDELADAYVEQMSALIEGGVDALLIETVFDTLNAKAALYAAEEAMERTGRKVLLMLSVTVSDTAGRTLSGQTMEAFLASVMHAPLFSIGLNCSFGARLLRPHLEVLSRRAPFYISVYPNAGLPNSLGEYDQTPEMMAEEMDGFVRDGLVNIIGGCCGTTDEHIARLHNIISYAAPHKPSKRPETLWLSGLEVLEKSPEIRFVNVGERCNVAGSRKFLRLIQDKNYEEALAIARKQVEDGALIIDINMDDGLLDAEGEMTVFLNLLSSEPEIAKVPVMIDSSKWEVIQAGLKCVQGKSIVNSISLKEGEELFLKKAAYIKRMGAAVVVMAFDEQGQATTYEQRIAVCERAYRLLVDKVGFDPHDIIFDPNVLAVATGIEEHDSYALDFIRATRWIKENLYGAHISGGVSNLSFSFRGNNYIREAMHAVFLYHAIENGMDMGIVNPSTTVIYNDIPADLLELLEDVILNRRVNASESLIEAAQRLKAGAETEKLSDGSVIESWRKETVEERLEYALIKGVGDYLDVDLHDALHGNYPQAVSIIEGPLMNAMNKVGEWFGAGKMFLPQVVKAARTMKKAVDILKPYIEEHSQSTNSAGKVLVATVKGDVHDIGKNIASLVMACNGYQVIDLGVMVPTETIVREAMEQQVDVVILSGLITPSLEEMVHVAQELGKAGFNRPLMVSGATTSELHTALKIAPIYKGVVVHLKDASQNSMAIARLMNPATCEIYRQRLEKEYATLRERNAVLTTNIVSFEEANRNKLELF
ncbi:MAG: methionine synthase [Bacteroidaceae bacterium]|nr:methionine synthase [Bacteroidaceae bacterium]